MIVYEVECENCHKKYYKEATCPREEYGKIAEEYGTVSGRCKDCSESTPSALCK